MKYTILFLIFFTYSCTFALDFETALEEFKQEYGEYGYNHDGYVNSKGEVKNNGLGCSAFVTVILYKMKYGKDWLKEYKKNWRLYQKTGRDIAGYFNFPRIQTMIYDKGKIIKVDGKRSLDKVYLFHIERESPKLQQHVGFIKVTKIDGISTTLQWHYSGLGDYNGLADGKFLDWFKNSYYYKGDTTMEFYEITF